MENKERKVLTDIAISVSSADFAQKSRSKNPNSGRMYEKYIPVVQEYAQPKAIYKWCNVEKVEDTRVTLDGFTFESKVLAAELKDKKKVILFVATAGTELDDREEIPTGTVKDVCKSVVLSAGVKGLKDELKNTFELDLTSMLQPGSLPDWPIVNNFALCDLIGNVGEIGVKLNDKGYMTPWHTISGILFMDNTGYKNCILCTNLGCVGRSAPFNPEEYKRIFG